MTAKTATIATLPRSRVVSLDETPEHGQRQWRLTVQWGPVTGARSFKQLRAKSFDRAMRMIGTTPTNTPIRVRVGRRSGPAFLVGVNEIFSFSTYAVQATMVGAGPLRPTR